LISLYATSFGISISGISWRGRSCRCLVYSMSSTSEKLYLTSIAGAIDCGIDAVVFLSQALPVKPLNDGGVLLLVRSDSSEMDHFEFGFDGV